MNIFGKKFCNWLWFWYIKLIKIIDEEDFENILFGIYNSYNNNDYSGWDIWKWMI